MFMRKLKDEQIAYLSRDELVARLHDTEDRLSRALKENTLLREAVDTLRDLDHPAAQAMRSSLKAQADLFDQLEQERKENMRLRNMR